MSIAATSFTVISVFALMLLGYSARKLGILSAKDSTALTNVMVYFAFPATIFVSIHGRSLTSDMLSVPLAMLGIELAILGAAYGIGRALKFDNSTIAGLMLVSAFGNTAFLGFPVVESAFGSSAKTAAVVLDQLTRNIPLNTIGIAIAASLTGAGLRKASLLDVLKSPMLIATVIALATRNIAIPPLIVQILSKIDAMTVPLSMICIGLTLSAGAAKRNLPSIGIAFLLKMIAFPILTYLALPLVGAHGMVGNIAVLESAMPTAIFSGVIATKYNANGPFAAGAILVMTLISVVWLPLVLMLLR